ncbi:MAG: PAS domain-containing protein [Kiritimatiellae bacterium]|nr:PAS domain-containing protein [Kiritimatiellia bacterium]
MKTKPAHTKSIRELIDLTELNELMSCFSSITGIPFLLLDAEGKTLISTTEADFCSRYIALNPTLYACCERSREHILQTLDPSKPYTLFTCGNGLTQAACPVLVAGRLVATIILCHFLLNDEHTEEQFRNIKKKIGPDQEAIEPLLKGLPMRTHAEIERIMLFYARLARMIGKDGLRRSTLRDLLRQEQILNENLNRHMEAQHKAEKEIRESKRQLTTLMSNLPGMAYRCLNNRQWTMVLLSEVCRELSGYSPAELTHNDTLSWNDIIHPDDRESVWKKVQEGLEQREQFSIDYRIITKDGAPKHVREKGKGIFDESGACLAIEGFIMDVTDEFITREKLTANEQRFKIFAEHARDVIYRMKLPERIYEYVSPAALELFGRPVEDFYRDAQCFMEQIHPDSVPYVLEQFAAMSQNGDVPASFEYKIITLDGEVKWILQRNAVLRDNQGALTAIEGILTDITGMKEIQSALKKSEEQLLAAQEMGHIGNWEYDMQTGRISGSDQALALCGLQRTAEHATLSVDDLLSSVYAQDRVRVASVFRNAILRETGFETEWRRDEQGTRCLHVIARFKKKTGNDRPGMWGTIQDVTAQRTLEKQLAHVQKMDAIGRMAGGVAHDFNNILQAVIGYADVILDKACAAPAILPEVDKIISAAEKARRMIKQLLTFGSDRDFSPAPLHLNETIEEMLDILRQLASATRSIEFKPSYPLKPISADTGRLEQILLNLVVNARDAMPAGGTITIGTEMSTLDDTFCEGFAELIPGDYVRLFVEDNGPGIPEKIMDQLFEPFFSTKDREHGTGLGLSTTYAIVQMHHGHIQAQNKPSGGAVFSVYLPVYHAAHPSGKTTDADPVAGGTETILLAEDDELIRPLSQNILQRNGYQVISARDGQEAIDLFMKHRADIDLAVLDIVMPRKSGRDVYDAISAVAPGLPVVFCTGYDDDLIKADYLLKIPGLLMHKPYSNKELLKAVRSLLP